MSRAPVARPSPAPRIMRAKLLLNMPATSPLIEPAQQQDSQTLEQRRDADEDADEAADEGALTIPQQRAAVREKKIAPAAPSVAAYVTAFANTAATSQPLISMSLQAAERLRGDREGEGSLGDMAVIRRHRGPLHACNFPAKVPAASSVNVWPALAPLSSGTGMSLPSRTSFNTASCAASLNLSVSVFGACGQLRIGRRRRALQFCMRQAGRGRDHAAQSQVPKELFLSINKVPFVSGQLILGNILAPMILYGYGLSSASYRVRIAMALKNLAIHIGHQELALRRAPPVGISADQCSRLRSRARVGRWRRADAIGGHHRIPR